MTQDLQANIRQKERELELVLALDHARDSLIEDGDPQAMFDQIVAVVKRALNADASALALIAETNDDIECASSVGAPEAVAESLCRQAMEQAEPAALAEAPWAYTLGVRIILDDFPMGGLMVARASTPFDAADIALIHAAESQIDSAALQARMVWKLAQRNRELEAIYEIDRLRDRTTNENDLISSFTGFVLQDFNAELCMILLTQVDSGELIIRGIIDKHEIPTTALEHIRNYARNLTIPQVIPTPEGIEDLILLAAPFIAAGARLGAVVVGRKQSFSIGDHRTLHAMMSQMDSAVVFSRIFSQLAQRKKELEIIYRIDRIRDREKDFDGMLQAVLTEMCEAVSSEMGYIMLYNATQEELELRSMTADGLISGPQFTEVINRVSRDALDQGAVAYSNTPEGAVRSIIAAPLILNERIIGVFGAVNSLQTRGFDAEDRRILSAITSQIDTAIFERLEARRMRALLSRSVDPKVLEHLLQRADTNLLSGERVILSVLFADLRGSTEWAERTEPEELVTTLNAYLRRMTDVIFEYGGTLDKFVGDEVIGLFGTPIPMHDHAYRAACAARKMQQIHVELQGVLAAQGRELPAMGVGISSGEAIAGEFGHPVRSEFTALGRIINLGSRLCGAAGGGQVLISETTYEMIRPLAEVNPLEPIILKGISHPAPIFELITVQQ